MSERKLPPGWVWTSLAAIAALKGGITKGQRRRPDEAMRLVPYLRVANVQRGYLELEEVKEIEATEAEIEELRLVPGDVLFNEGGDRDKLGRGWVWNGEIPVCIHQNHVFRARIRAAVIHPKLLSWYGNTLGQQYFLEQGKQTTNLASINMTKLGALPVPVPPLPEQIRIVAEIEKHLSRLDAGISALKRIQANLKRQRAAILKAACEGRLVPTEAELARLEGRGYERASQLVDRISNERRSRRAADLGMLPALPEGWTWSNMGQVTVIQGGIQKQPKRTPLHNSYPFLRVANVLRGKLDLQDVHRIELFGDEPNRLRLVSGDLLIVEGNGSPSEIGRMAIWSGTIPDCVHQNHVIRARPMAGILSGYVIVYWNSPEGMSRVMSVASSTSGLYTLSVTKIEGLPIPIPPTSEQVRIVAEVERRMSVLDEMERSIELNLARAGRLRQTVLRQAFDGKLVPQDPTDEPASVLLERLRAEQPQPAPDAPKRRAPRRRAPGVEVE